MFNVYMIQRLANRCRNQLPKQNLIKLSYNNDIAAQTRNYTISQNGIDVISTSCNIWNTCNDIYNLHAKIFNINRRYYRPDKRIDWYKIKQNWRAKQLMMKKKKHKNHPRVALRFRLTRFGWERLQSGRYAKKLNLTRQQRRNKLRIRFVARCDLAKLKRQMPGYSLRIRDVPIDNNPNIQKIRKHINHYFG
ncbi:hypothetical protein BdWA1_002437 [Babesia duncani]|uniref:Uncharacterized protein n=1 Tax=Babesia duncani TaxID=323732 RepID=A0AAD9PH46_9APIC|nr:hypothetical protein BdWA1_003773 [Babesia duncani]KAK2195841.1 hypothetical protein BdWA1_002437 [Babesia duncani]